MNKPQTATFAIACIAIFAVNFPYVLPRYYKGRYHGVGSDIVAVHVPSPDSSRPTVVIPETGQLVSVYLRNGYRDDEIQFAPRLTLALLVGFGLLYIIITRITVRAVAPTQSQ